MTGIEMKKAETIPIRAGNIRCEIRAGMSKVILPILLLFLVRLGALGETPSPSPSGSGSASPAPTTIAQSVTTLSAQRAAAERSRIYKTGRAYGQWLDDRAKESGNAFLQSIAFERVSWTRLIVAAFTLAFLALLTLWFLWFVRRRAGELESGRQQTIPALILTALRKPLALLVLVVGGVFGLMPLVTGIEGRTTRVFYAGLLTGILYAGQIVAVLWLIFRGILAMEKRMRSWATRTHNIAGAVAVPILGQTLRLAVPLLGLILLLPLLKLPPAWTWVTQKGFGILLIAALSFLIVRGLNAIQSALMRRHRVDAPDNMSARRILTQVSVIRKVIVSAVIVIATGSILMMFDPVRQFGTSILASAGIAGVVIGFAAQKTLGNVLAGIQIALTQPLLIDDIVVVEGEFGQIEEITLTYVTVRTWDLRRIILPITYFIEKPFQNWSRVSTEMLGTVTLYLDYQVPMGELRKELKDLLDKNPKWDRRVCNLQVTDAKQNSIEVRALVSAADSGKLGDLRSEIREGLINFLWCNYPESLPRNRTVSIPVADERKRHRNEIESTDGGGPGKEHERGPTSPGVHPKNEASDGR